MLQVSVRTLLAAEKNLAASTQCYSVSEVAANSTS